MDRTAMRGLKRAVPEDSILTQPQKKNRQDLIYGHHPDHELGFDSHSSFQGSLSTQRDPLISYNPPTHWKEENFEEFDFDYISLDSPETYSDLDDPPPTPGKSIVDDPFSYNPPTSVQEENFEEFDFDYISLESPETYSDLDDPPPTPGKSIVDDPFSYNPPTSVQEENFEEFDFDYISLDSPETYSDLDDPPPTPGKSIVELYESSISDSDSDDNVSSFTARVPSTGDCQASVNDSDAVSDEEAEQSSSDEGSVGDEQTDLVSSDEGSVGDEQTDLVSSDENEDSSDEDEDNDVYVEELCMHCGRVPTKELFQKREQQLYSLRGSITSPSYLTRRHMIQAPLCSCCGYPMPVSPLATPAKPSSHPCNLQRRLSERRPDITLWLELMTTSYHRCKQQMEAEAELQADLQVSEDEKDMLDFYGGALADDEDSSSDDNLIDENN